jgi:predicted ATPase/DNA-binding winged helix-turn-helix (wHTH) protein
MLWTTCAISFGPFRLFPAQRLLLEGDCTVRLGGRAFDILCALVERAGEVLDKDQLIGRVWPKTVVEECNLKTQVSALRRALGDGGTGHRYIVCVTGRGYSFVGPVGREAECRALPHQANAKPDLAQHNLPSAITGIIGRENTVSLLASRLPAERLVTILGPGGIGKTTVALAVAQTMVSSYEHGTWLIDLAPLEDPQLVPDALAITLGLQPHAEDPLATLIASLSDRRMLLVLDNCEHVIEPVASITRALLRRAPGISVLATSREPLGVEGERHHRLEPLTSPLPSSDPTAAEAMAFSAVQLFVERAASLVEDFTLTNATVPFVVEICRRLDGLPLAIEFAAAHVLVLGVEKLAAHLGESLEILRAPCRRAAPRHRTIQAAVDWSYGLLSEDDQQFFRRLAIFAGGFTLEAAARVAGDAHQREADAIDPLTSLIAKSLVVADVSGGEPRLRLLETIRAYAFEKLAESGELEVITRRHAIWLAPSE